MQARIAASTTLVTSIVLSVAAGAQLHSARTQPEAAIDLYAPEQHDLYDGRFVLEARRVYQVGTLEDPPGWNHMGNDAKNVRPVGGTVTIDVNEIEDSGVFRAELDLPEGKLVIEMDRFVEASPCQHGGVAAYLYEHGDSGCGDTNWPKTFIWVAGWGTGHATLDGEPLYRDYQIHFMVTQGIRDRESLVVHYPRPGRTSAAGDVNPAAQQVDFYIRSPETDDRNNPPRKVFDHFFAMEVTWK
ncbi:MAG TPA: hypothetical protein VM198_03965 [Longimicrobiales bacterium]|nr:hypothetical protein [Longimicrobiales bacterium]